MWSRDAESMHAVAKVWAVVPEVTRVNSMAPMNGAVAGTWEGVEKGVGIGCRMLSCGFCAAGFGMSDHPEGWMVPMEHTRYEEIANGAGAAPTMAELALMVQLKRASTIVMPFAAIPRSPVVEDASQLFSWHGGSSGQRQNVPEACCQPTPNLPPQGSVCALVQQLPILVRSTHV